MKKIIGIIAVSAAIVALSSCGGKAKPFDYGTLEGTRYTNSFFNFSLDLPQEWYVLDRDEIRDLQAEGAGAIPNEALRKEIMNAKDIRKAILLSAFNYKPKAQDLFNASFQVVVENVSGSATRDGGEYLTNVIESLKATGINFTGLDNPVKSAEIGGVRFDMIEVKSNYMGYDVVQDYYAAVRDGFVLCFISTCDGQRQREAIRGILGSVTFE